ncbi:pilus assembly protein TadG-related protein [Burkholderiaceae bacterium FT117]|uniref:pilus assembly protein TadG-related protein n=1 Tax=Zeimonas sediminis TaxID=2944268 RepID=UPI0023430C83|nr:pilus assembly protein TadG-related protein [Zeimonas sediminis]MCM5572022.1 pilus assembly protein TadG-related protein [Zeimonas sediminis]
MNARAMSFACVARLPERQSGQALVLGLVLLFAAVLGLFFLFSTGQALGTRQRLDNAADAAAWSAALWRARVLNFHAYSNRAIVAQEVAVAQAVTMTSWAKYFERFTANASVLAAAYPPVATVISAAASIAANAREMTERAASDEIGWRADPLTGYKQLLLRSQALLHRSADTFGMGAVANEIARANDPRFFAFAMTDAGGYERFTRRWDTDADRERLQKVVLDALDPFTSGPRGLDLRLLLMPSSCAGTTLDFDKWFHWYRKRGGTVMSSLDRWESADTGSIHDWRRRGFIFGSCRDRESIQLGWGAAEATNDDPVQWLLAYPGDADDNGGAALLAAFGISGRGYRGFHDYDGIARVRDLNYSALDNPRFPVTRVAVLARVEGNTVRTANALNLGTGRLRLFERYAGGRIWSLSAAETYFRRPPGAPERIEYASLYSPYWQVRLVEPSGAERAAAAAYVR